MRWKPLDLKHWRAGVVTCFVIAMFVTPADPISTLLAAAGLCTVYFLAAGLWTGLNRM